MKTLAKFSFGVGDRFAHQAKAQLQAFQMLSAQGVDVVPAWTKSNREHSSIGSQPQSVLEAARSAVQQLAWKGPWHVDADHIRLETVDRFVSSSDFFTIDVADSIGTPASSADVDAFVAAHVELLGSLQLSGMTRPLIISVDDIRQAARKYLLATQEAGAIYRHIAAAKGEDNFIAEVSMDETDLPQTPPELLIILAALADQRIRLQTIAPKFTGRFNKGVDYVGDLDQFEQEFHDDLAVIAHAVQLYRLPDNLKLSIHSGSDKFSLYPIMRRVLASTGAGLHLKTAGTTWLEELIGLAEAGGEGLRLAQEIYAYAHSHFQELCAPYASVVDIDPAKLPEPLGVSQWSGTQFAQTLRHVPSNPHFNPHFRQLLHVSFKVAAQMGDRYTQLLQDNDQVVGRQVTENLYKRHFLPLFCN